MLTDFDRALLASGIVAPLVYFLSTLAAAAAYKGYRHRTQVLSELGTRTSPRAAFFNAGLALTGCLLAACGVLASEVIGRGHSGAPILYGLTAFGLTSVLMAVFPCDPAPHRPPSQTGAVHGLLGLFGALALTYTVVAIGILWWPHHRVFAIYCFTDALLSMLLLALLMGSVATRRQGLLQRLYVAGALGWPLTLVILILSRGSCFS